MESSQTWERVSDVHVIQNLCPPQRLGVAPMPRMSEKSGYGVLVSWPQPRRQGSEVANTYKNIMQDSSRQLGNTRGSRNRKQKTHLDELVPAGRDDHGVLGVGAEADARDPVGVALLGDGVLAVTEGVPQLDGLVPRAGDDLAVVGGEGDREDVVVVADEAAGGRAGGKLPKTEGLVPRGGEGVGAVGRDDLGRVRKKKAQTRQGTMVPGGWFGGRRTQSETMWE